MIWLTWRQFRAQAWIAAAALAAVAVAMTVNGLDLAHLWADSGAAGCHPASACGTELSSFLDSAQQGSTATLFGLSLALMYVVPPLIGAFWGAPLIARELETGTYRLVWNQSVTRQRWLAIKVATIGLAGVAVTGLLSLAVTWAAQRLDQASMNRIDPMHFGGRGVVPIGYTAFAFALGLMAGVLIRRTVPAMAGTLAVYTAAVVVVTTKLRAHLLPAKHISLPLTADSIREFGTSAGGTVVRVQGDVNLPGAWVLHNETLTAAGKPFTGPADTQFCSRDAPPRGCLEWLGAQNLHQGVDYQPASRFWALQWTETGIFLALALVLIGLTFWLLRRRTT